jgi:hypothetical protein
MSEQEYEFSQLIPAKVNALKFLCLRTTGPKPEFQDPCYFIRDGISTTHTFATYAFNAFPNLLFITSSDFSYGCRSIEASEIFCRRPFSGAHGKLDPPNVESVEYHHKGTADGL